MARRSSARLRNRSSTTPKRVSLSHDAPRRTPKTVPAKLASLDEGDDEDMPGAFPRSVSPPAIASPSAMRGRMGRSQQESTPQKTTPIKPSPKDMHPGHHHQTTAKPHQDARWLGFSNMAPNTEPAKHASKIATFQGTPTKAQVKQPEKNLNSLKSPDFKFTFQREHSLELSPEAKKLMLEKREEAAKIRAQMAASGEKAENIDQAVAKKLAAPKSKGRFSDIHRKQFEKMESIAGYPSSARKAPNNITVKTPAQHAMSTSSTAAQDAIKSLKRSPSKAQLDQSSPAGFKPLARSPSKPTSSQGQSQLPRSTSKKSLEDERDEPESPAKRMKRAAGDDTANSRPLFAPQHEKPSTPQKEKSGESQAGYPNISHLTTPTQSSIARAKSTTTSKIPELSASPYKPAVFGTQAAAEGQKQPEPLLARSPSKMSLFGRNKTAEKQQDEPRSLLSRSPFKRPAVKSQAEHEGDGQQKQQEAPPLLSRSPLKGSVAKHTEQDEAPSRTTSIPLLARSPSKPPTTASVFKASDSSAQAPSQTPSKPTTLMSRFNLLRASPVKSILRTPQRLYSNDPAKIAAGTHVATPENKSSNLAIPFSAIPKPPATAPARKHVDFSSSTKARHETSQERSTPSKASSTPQTTTTAKAPDSSPAASVAYPSLSLGSVSGCPSAYASPSPQKRRQTVAPGDFTFRAGAGNLIFAASPNAPAAGSKRGSIRHVSAEPTIVPTQPALAPAAPPATGSKKRKFDFEDAEAATQASMGYSDKENGGTASKNDGDEDARPAKRARPNFAAPTAATAQKATATAADVKDVSPAKKVATRMPTAGVRPKKDGKLVKEKAKPRASVRPGTGGTISRERLNALAQPKKRGE